MDESRDCGTGKCIRAYRFSVVRTFPDFHGSQRNRELYGTRRAGVTLENRTYDGAEISW